MRCTLSKTPVLDLSKAPGKRHSWGKHRLLVYLWGAAELVLVTNPWQISSALRVATLRLFGAEIGHGVIFRPRTRVSFPWKLKIGDRCWIGEGVQFHNQDDITIGHDVAISQGAFLTTGSHAHRVDMALITRPIVIDPGVWITTRCIVLGGTHMGVSSLARPMTVVSGAIPENAVVSGPNSEVVGTRFPTG